MKAKTKITNAPVACGIIGVVEELPVANVQLRRQVAPREASKVLKGGGDGGGRIKRAGIERQLGGWEVRGCGEA